MAFKEVQSLDAENTISLGGFDKKTRKENPTQAEGYYLGSRLTEGKLGDSYLHIIQTPKGNLGVWGKTDLDRKLKQVEPGTMVRITQSGTRPSNKGNDMYLFRVEVDSDDTVAVNLAPKTAYEEADSADAFDDADFVDAEQLDEVVPARPTRPAKPATAPDAARQARVKELLSKR